PAELRRDDPRTAAVAPARPRPSARDQRHLRWGCVLGRGRTTAHLRAEIARHRAQLSLKPGGSLQLEDELVLGRHVEHHDTAHTREADTMVFAAVEHTPATP